MTGLGWGCCGRGAREQWLLTQGERRGGKSDVSRGVLTPGLPLLSPFLLRGAVSPSYICMRGLFSADHATPSRLLKGNLICRSSVRTALGYGMRKRGIKRKEKSQVQTLPFSCPKSVLALAKDRAGVPQFGGSASRRETEAPSAVCTRLSRLSWVLQFRWVWAFGGLTHSPRVLTDAGTFPTASEPSGKVLLLTGDYLA